MDSCSFHRKCVKRKDITFEEKSRKRNGNESQKDLKEPKKIKFVVKRIALAAWKGRKRTLAFKFAGNRRDSTVFNKGNR